MQGIASGPDAFLGSTPLSRLSTPATLKIMSGIEGMLGDHCKVILLLVSVLSFVKTEENWFARIFDFLLGSEYIMPLSLSGATPVDSVRWDLI